MANDKQRQKRLADKRKRRSQRQDKREKAHTASHATGLLVERLLPAIAYLEAEGYTTESLERLALELASVGEPKAIARPLLAAYLQLAPELAPSPLDAWRFAGALAFLAGPEEASKAVRALWQRDDLEQPHLALAMTSALEAVTGSAWEGMSGLDAFLAAGAPRIAQAAGTGESAMRELLFGLFTTPSAIRPAYLAALLEAIAAPDDRDTFAAIALLSPLDAKSHEACAQALAATATGHAFLSDLGADTVGSDAYALARRARMRTGAPLGKARRGGIRGVPLRWPVEDAFATWPDGRGSQAVYLVRKRPYKKHALIGAVLSDVRGLVDVLVAPDLSDAELDDLIDKLEAGAELAPIEASHAIARLDDALARSRARHYPPPLDYFAERYLLSGLGAQGAPDLAAEAESRARRDLLAHTGALLHTAATDSWHFVDDGTEHTDAFFDDVSEFMAGLGRGRRPSPKLPSFPAAIDAEPDAPYGFELSDANRKALLALARRHAPALFPEQARARWRDRLLQAMPLFDADERPHLAELAATAAWAIAPASGVPLGEQPFVLDMLMRSAFSGSGAGVPLPVEQPPTPLPAVSTSISAPFVSFLSPLLEALPDSASLGAYQAAAELGMVVWNQAIAGRNDFAPLKPPLAALAAALGPMSQQEMLVLAQTAAELLARKQQYFGGARRVIQEVWTRFEGSELKFKVLAEGPLPC